MGRHLDATWIVEGTQPDSDVAGDLHGEASRKPLARLATSLAEQQAGAAPIRQESCRNGGAALPEEICDLTLDGWAGRSYVPRLSRVQAVGQGPRRCAVTAPVVDVSLSEPPGKQISGSRDAVCRWFFAS